MVFGAVSYSFYAYLISWGEVGEGLGEEGEEGEEGAVEHVWFPLFLSPVSSRRFVNLRVDGIGEFVEMEFLLVASGYKRKDYASKISKK